MADKIPTRDSHPGGWPRPAGPGITYAQVSALQTELHVRHGLMLSSNQAAELLLATHQEQAGTDPAVQSPAEGDELTARAFFERWALHADPDKRTNWQIWSAAWTCAMSQPQPKHTDAELESLTGEPHVDGWPLYSCLPPAQPKGMPETCAICGEGKALLVRHCSHCGSDYAGSAEMRVNAQAPAPGAGGVPDPMTLLGDDDILNAAQGWREFDAPDALVDDPIGRKIYGACRAVLNEYRDRLAATQALAVAHEQPRAAQAFLCRAWGESDFPAAELVPDWNGVRAFMVREWLGEEDATDYDGTVTLDRLKEDFDEHEEDQRGGPYEIEFEIGGVSIERVTGFAFAPVSHPPVQGSGQ